MSFHFSLERQAEKLEKFSNGRLAVLAADDIYSFASFHSNQSLRSHGLVAQLVLIQSDMKLEFSEDADRLDIRFAFSWRFA